MVYMSTPKEPCYFDSDLPFPNSPRNEAQYLRCFKNASPQHRIIGEASSNYLFSQVAIPSILRFNPDARFIAMLRNPIDMAASLHAESVKSLVEDVTDFHEAWKLQAERRKGRSLPRVCYQKEFVLYGDFCKLGEQLTRLYSHVQPDRVHLVFFDELSRSPRDVYLQVLAFLGLPDDGRKGFPVLNARAAARSTLIRRLLVRLLALRESLPINVHTGLIRAALSLNLRYERRQPLDPAFRQELADYFRSDVALISRIANRDLSYWLDPAKSTPSVAAPPHDTSGVTLLR